MLPLPRNARSIVEARAGGLKPAEPIIVSFVGQTDWPNPHVFAESGQAYDWRFLHGLTAAIVVRKGIDARNALVSVFDETDIVAGLPILIDPELEQAAYVVMNRPLRLAPIAHGTPAWKELFA